MKLGGEFVIVLFAVSVAVIPLLVMGIVQFRSRRPVGFWAGVEPPSSEQVTDVRAYNRKHGVMWLMYGIGLAVFFISGCIIDSSGLVSTLIGVIWSVGGIFVMMVYHSYLESRYVKKVK